MVVGAPAQQNFTLFIFNNNAAGALYQCPVPYDFAQIRYITAQKIPPLHGQNAFVFLSCYRIPPAAVKAYCPACWHVSPE